MRILLATDGSTSAGIAVDLVAGIDWPGGTSIRVVQAIQTSLLLVEGTWPVGDVPEAEALEADARQAAEASVEAARERLERPGRHVTTAVLAGRPATAIVDAAQTTGADLIVLGSRGHGSIARMVLGSVSQEVVDHSPVPVLVARGTTLGKVVFAWDGSDSARGAAELLKTWPMFRQAAIQVVSVADLQVPWWTGFPATGVPELVPMYVEAASASRQVHADLASTGAAELTRAGLEATAEVREGDAAAEIIAAAGAAKADLIVLGTRGRSGLARLMLGSVARNVLHHASSSVLVTKAPAGPTPA